MKRIFAIAALSLVTALAACADDGGRGAGVSETTISGEFAYRERIALLPGAEGIVTLNDISRADAPSEELARQTIELSGAPSPYAFELLVPDERLDATGRYAVRAEIRSADGKLLWTTDRITQIDPRGGDQSVGLMTLKRTPG